MSALGRPLLAGANWANDADGMIARLDAALADGGRTVLLQYVTGSKNQATFSVLCPAAISRAVASDAVPGQGLAQQQMTIIISPTPLDEAQWPGPSVPRGPADPRIPVTNKCQVVVDGIGRNVESAYGIKRGNPEKLVRIVMVVKG